MKFIDGIILGVIIVTVILAILFPMFYKWLKK